MSPTWTRITGPGTVPPKVQTFCTNPSATVMSSSVITRSTSWTVPGSAFGATGSYRTAAGAFGSGSTSVVGAGPPWSFGSMLGLAAASPVTTTPPVIPAAAWPGIEHMKVVPPAGISTVRVAVSPGWADTVSPVANVMSWTAAPVLMSLTSYFPGAGTSSVAGVNPRSKAVISRVFVAGAAEADAAAASGWLAGAIVPPGPPADEVEQAPITRAVPIGMDVKRSMDAPREKHIPVRS